MKIGDRTDFLETATIELMGGVVVTVNGLPSGFDEDMAKDLPSPKPPYKPVKDANGNFVYKDAKRKIFKTAPDEMDPKYVAASTQQTRRQAAYIIYNGTKTDPNISWDAKPEDFKDMGKFCDAIKDELKAANIGAGYVGKLMDCILAVSGISQEKVNEVTDRFLAVSGSEV